MTIIVTDTGGDDPAPSGDDFAQGVAVGAAGVVADQAQATADEALAAAQDAGQLAEQAMRWAMDAGLVNEVTAEDLAALRSELMTYVDERIEEARAADVSQDAGQQPPAEPATHDTPPTNAAPSKKSLAERILD